MLKIEFKKLKLFSLLTTILIIPLLANIFGTINYLQNQEILKNKWESLWTQTSLFYFMFFIIPLIAIIVSSLWSVEHKAGLKLIRTSPIKNISFIMSKSIVALILISLCQIYFIVLFIMSGKFICGFNIEGLGLYFYYIGISILSSIPIISIMNYQSLKFKSLGLIVLISILISIFGFGLVAQNILPIFQNLIASSKLAITTNHFELISRNEGLKMIIFSLFETIIFTNLANKFLKYE
ncbi:MAG: ABC transporter permease [Peptoniphilus harei]|uniref:ABC transporter permease n=1 Tax=Peptoniphilus harei TaxID=54005 RepID=UPI00291130AF|nr:ABC transporter permease [Peptoniphilus harei]MDU5470451.1 ABC transporter permease [Peptoniphilus harei]MDU6097687.1 ABC transporter permease [Peptoniphilus harei]